MGYLELNKCYHPRAISFAKRCINKVASVERMIVEQADAWPGPWLIQLHQAANACRQCD